MLSFRLAEQFIQRAIPAIPSPRGLATLVAPGAFFRRLPFGAWASLGAIALGATLLVVNVSREHRLAAEAAIAAEAPPAAVAPVRAVALDPPEPAPASPDPIAATVAPPQPEKSVARVDTTPVGAIDETPKIKPKHKHRPKKALDTVQ